MRILITGGSGFIGTNLIERVLSLGHEVLDASRDEPLDTRFRRVWERCDILDGQALTRSLQVFKPEAVIHLAARADCDETTTVEAGYRANTDGTASLLAAVKATPSVKRLIVTSSQFVCGPGRLPKSDEDYFPHTVYGQSKVITEKLTRRAGLDCVWTLVRPTNVWGPWHLRYSREFWRVAKRGLYLHPGGQPVVRSYAYVGTVVDQMLGILAAPAGEVNARTFYLTDPPDDIYHWANAFCRALNGKPARRVPRVVLALAGRCGDLITAVTGRQFYITSSRYRSMITGYATPTAMVPAVSGKPVRSLESGVSETVAWLRRELKEFGGAREF